LDTKPWIDIHRIKPPFPRLALSELPLQPSVGNARVGSTLVRVGSISKGRIGIN